MADNNGRVPDYFLCVVETTEKERNDRAKTYPVRMAGVWRGEKGHLNCGRFKLNVLVTRNTRIVLFENTSREQDTSVPAGVTDEDVPF